MTDMSPLADLLGAVVGSGPSEVSGAGRVALRLATTVSFDYPSQTAVVLMPDGSTLIAATSGQVPIIAKPIWVVVVGEVALTVGRSVMPPMGTVNEPASNGFVNVTGDDGVVYRVGYPSTYTPAAGHRVLLWWEANGHILTRVESENPVSVLPDVPSQTIQKTQTFDPIDSGSYRESWSGPNSDVYLGDQYQSAGWFYGTQIADSIPDDAQILGVRTYLEVTEASGAASMPLGLHTSLAKGSGQLTIDNAIDIGAMPDGFAADVALPSTWGDLLKTGDRRGIGTVGAGYRRLNGAPTTGALTISWEE